jgi:hypothetical protein
MINNISYQFYNNNAVLRIQTLLIQFRILLFILIRIRRILLLNFIRIQIRLFNTDPVPDPYCFNEVMYQKQFFFYIYS